MPRKRRLTRWFSLRYYGESSFKPPGAQAEAQCAAVLQVFSTRGLTVSPALPRRLTELEGVSTAMLVQAVLGCRDEADFLLRLTDRR